LSVTIHYPFHPHVGKELEVVLAARRPDFPVTVRAPDGYDLRVPSWMLGPTARVEISPVVVIAIEAWTDAIAQIEAHEALRALLKPTEAGVVDANQDQGGGRAATRVGRKDSATCGDTDQGIGRPVGAGRGRGRRGTDGAGNDRKVAAVQRKGGRR